jgi:hypothetical protein
MRITVNELRYVIRESLLGEDQDSVTISDELSPDEQELRDTVPRMKAGSGSLKASTPQQVKLNAVKAVLARMGYGKDVAHKKAITQRLPPWLDEMDPTDLFMAEPEELARQFAETELR